MCIVYIVYIVQATKIQSWRFCPAQGVSGQGIGEKVEGGESAGDRRRTCLRPVCARRERTCIRMHLVLSPFLYSAPFQETPFASARKIDSLVFFVACTIIRIKCVTI